MSRYIPDKIREIVKERAFYLCEYCLLHESQSFVGFEIDHIISIKHGGSNEASNLAYTCQYCNQFKGADIGTILLPDEEYIRFYNPRKDKWKNHFDLEGSLIIAKTPQAEATIKMLKLNQPDRLIERQIWLDSNFYPHPNAERLFSRP